MIFVIGWIASILIMQDLGPCKGVIGIAFDRKGVVGHVFPNTPAEKAGFQVGDQLTDKKQLKGSPGTVAIVSWESEAGMEEALIERICIDDIGVDYW